MVKTCDPAPVMLSLKVTRGCLTRFRLAYEGPRFDRTGDTRMTVGQAICRRVFEENECPASKLNTRKSVAIGDLHGDFHRLVRLLEEEGILIRGTYAWNPQ